MLVYITHKQIKIKLQETLDVSTATIDYAPKYIHRMKFATTFFKCVCNLHHFR